jgi:hypothetical protein
LETRVVKQNEEIDNLLQSIDKVLKMEQEPQIPQLQMSKNPKLLKTLSIIQNPSNQIVREPAILGKQKEESDDDVDFDELENMLQN